MRIVVIGSGLMGVTTAYYLCRRGHQVTVIDRQAGPGREASFANGSLLTPSMAEPWNSPGCWRELLGSLGRSDAALQLHFRTLPALASWGMRFLWSSRTAASERNALSNLRLALHSLQAMESLRQQTGIEYARRALGALKIFRDRRSLDQTLATLKGRLTGGISFRRLSPQELMGVEPVLAPIAHQLAGAIHYEADETGDAYRFCVALAEHARQQGVEFRYSTQVLSLEARSGRITAVISARDRFVADRYIVAAGSHCRTLLRQVGISLPVQPAKGYSVTVDGNAGDDALRIPIIDDQWHAVIVPLDGAIRVAGTAEFAGYDESLNPDRVRNLTRLLQRVLPRAQYDPATARTWCGLRAMSTDGVPIIGATPVSNLMVNTGHGHLGWTMAAGSSQLLSELICGDFPSIDPTPYSLARF
jgi:D-amino-acid dehydrogenase